MKRLLPYGIVYYQTEDLEKALIGADLLIGGVSSFGVDWFGEHVLPLVPDSLPVLSVTKGLQNMPGGKLVTFPHLLKERTGGRLSLNAIGGPCTSYELADRRHSHVAFCGEDMVILRNLKGMLETDYYHISLSTDVLGVECAVAMKNAYALGVSLAIGMVEQTDGIGCTQAYNPQAALFGQSVKEMGKMIALVGGGPENIVYAAGDLYVTIFGGRTRALGIRLGRGMRFDNALKELSGVTLESVVIARRTIAAMAEWVEMGLARREDFPLLHHIAGLLNDEEPKPLDWTAFETER
jgi:glycerol-3-phosphate dehydrogenase (NAD(P)+)